MGATRFSINHRSDGTPEEAFKEAVEEARYEYGNRGDTGTIAEKDEFQFFALPDGLTAEEYEDVLMNRKGCPVDEVDGPAGCIPIDGGYRFFGWARE